MCAAIGCQNAHEQVVIIPNSRYFVSWSKTPAPKISITGIRTYPISTATWKQKTLRPRANCLTISYSRFVGTSAKNINLDKPFQTNSHKMGASLAQGHENLQKMFWLFSIIRPSTGNSARCHLRRPRSCTFCVHRGAMLHHSIWGVQFWVSEHKPWRSHLGESKSDNYPSSGTLSLFRNGFEEIVAITGFSLGIYLKDGSSF